MPAPDSLGERAARIFESASKHDGRYLLPRRYPGEETGANYEACRALVLSGHAEWLSYYSCFAPGIRLTGKPRDADGQFPSDTTLIGARRR